MYLLSNNFLTLENPFCSFFSYHKKRTWKKKKENKHVHPFRDVFHRSWQLSFTRGYPIHNSISPTHSQVSPLYFFKKGNGSENINVIELQKALTTANRNPAITSLKFIGKYIHMPSQRAFHALKGEQKLSILLPNIHNSFYSLKQRCTLTFRGSPCSRCSCWRTRS